MAISVSDLENWVINPLIQDWTAAGFIGRANKDADNSSWLRSLLSGTAACESTLGLHLSCTATGGLGLYRITPAKHREVWDRVLIHTPELASRVRGLASQQQFLCAPDQELATNLSYASAIALVIYLDKLERTPAVTHDLNTMAQTWSREFDNGTGTERDPAFFARRYRKYILQDRRQLVA